MKSIIDLYKFLVFVELFIFSLIIVSSNMIFISYNHSSKKLVRKVVERLKNENLKIWYDEDKISPGDELSKKMQEGILNSDHVLFFISKKYIASQNCNLEFYFAQNRNKNCIYLVLEKIDPNEIQGIQIYIFGNSVRLDVYKLKKWPTIDKALIEDIYNNISPALNLKCSKIEVKSEVVKMKRDHYFIGREDVFKKIDRSLGENKIVLLHGIPGVGKTSTAIEFILRKYDNGTIKQYFVFYADQVHKIHESIFQYCKRLKLCDDSADIDTRIATFIDFIYQAQNIILFFDNVEKFDDVIKLIDYEILKKPTIITSRKTKAEYECIDILPFSLEDSKCYIQKKLKHLKEDDIKMLINHIKVENECLTYKVILTTSCLLNDPTIRVKDLIFKNFTDSYFSELITNIGTESKDAITILQYVCFLHPDEISLKILEKIKIEKPLSKVLQIILNYNFCKIVNPNSDEVGINVHRILQNDIQNECLKNEDEKKLTVEKISEILNELCPSIKQNPDEEWENAIKTIPHIKHLFKNIGKFYCLNYANLQYKASLYEHYLNQNFEASALHAKTDLDIKKHLLKGDHTDLATALNNVGSVYSNLGKDDEALRYYNESLEMTQRLFKGDHTSIATSLNNVGSVYDNLGKYDEALRYCKDSLEMKQRLFKGDHSSIATSLNNIASIYSNLGKDDEALIYYNDSLEMTQRLFKGDHSLIATSLNNIGFIYKNLGKTDEALKCYKDSLEMTQRLFKGDHSSIATSLNNIGLIYKNLGKYDEAFGFYKDSLDMMQRIFKDDHSFIAACLHNIGLIYKNLGKTDDALRYYKDSLEMKQRLFKGDHIEITSSLSKIGLVYIDLGRYDEACRYFKYSLDMKLRLII